MALQLLFTDKPGSPFIKPLNPKIKKIELLFIAPIHFLQK